jgi:hypothetical protein
MNSFRQQYADNQNICFLPAILSTSTRRGFTSSFSTGPPGDRSALHYHWRAIAMQPNGLVPGQTLGILPVAQEQVGLAAAEAAALRINLNIQGCGVVALPMHAPFRAPLLLPLLLSHNLPFPRVH